MSGCMRLLPISLGTVGKGHGQAKSVWDDGEG